MEESNILRPFMSDAIKDVSKACQTMEGRDTAPSSAVKILRVLQSEVTKIYILRLCSWMRSTTGELSKDESWVPVSTLERNKSPYAISFLPLGFQALTASVMDQINVMIQNMNGAAKQSNMFTLAREIKETVRLAFLNCFLDFAGYLEMMSGELTERNKEPVNFPNGILVERQAVCDSHRKLLMILSNIGFCKDQLSQELYDKYKHIWLQSGEKGEAESDIQDLVMSFSALEEKVLELYTYSKAQLMRSAATNYLLDSGVQWGAASPVKGVQDAAVELLHTMVAVHAEVFSGAKPLLEKTLGILVEGLIDTFLSLFHENKSKELKALDANGFCQLMLELEYFETILNAYFTPDAREALKSLQGLLLEKATESMSESTENVGHQRRPTRGSEDALSDDRQGSNLSPDDLIALGQQYSSELLQAELERTRINIACFMEPVDLVPETLKANYSSFRGTVDSPGRSHRGQTTGSRSKRR